MPSIARSIQRAARQATIGLCCLHVCALSLATSAAVPAPTAEQGDGLGYPSVAAALDALKKSSGAKLAIQDGWTIVTEAATDTLWSFTPATHPAHPAVVKRRLVSEGGSISIRMSALCEAEKSACDRLMAEFQALNERMRSSMHAAAANAPAPTQGVVVENAAVEEVSRRFFRLVESGQLADAYAMLSPANQALFSLDQWGRTKREVAARFGSAFVPSIKRITRYRDPPGQAPGDYFAVDYTGATASVPVRCGYLIWHAKPPGEFRLVREEVNHLDAETMGKMTPAQIEEMQRQFGCR